ncbi:MULTISPECIES: hypothetical protein [unclassified Microbacterium]|uniref:hypothetical protein n=1 Tax=unclassified Microbacterium TaxID=2609290 RepID=UPI0011BEAD02|nr:MULTISPECIES: hypothetical protein [unclassified Microbacterium]NYF26693.1 hypothetical protein [Microbacterium sp. JAI119]
MQERGGARQRMLHGASVIAAIMLTAGCTPQQAVGPEDWTLEAIPFQSSSVGAGPEATPAGEPIDLAYGMRVLSDDGAGGFWTVSSGSWLHVGANGQTLTRFNTEPEDPLSHVGAIAALSPTELVLLQGDRLHVMPMLSVLDTTTMAVRDLPGDAVGDEGDFDFGDFEFGDVAVHEGDALVVRYQPRPSDGYLDYEVLRVDVDSGARTLLHGGPIDLDDAPGARPGVPPISLDVDDAGHMYLATPSARIVLAADGTELSREAQVADRPLVAVAPDGTALWWGGRPQPSDAQGVIVGGSSDARAAIERRMRCTDIPSDGTLRSGDALRLGNASGEHPLPFLCGANAAVWAGDSWVVATGGEGDGVLVRLRPPLDTRL